MLESNQLQAQVACQIPNPPDGVSIHYVGSEYGIYTLSEAIDEGKMAPCADCTNGYWPLQWIQIGGTFEIDDIPECYCQGSLIGGYQYGNLTYAPTRSRIIMEPDAKVIISSGPNFQFTIVSTIIHGCNEMWNDIQVLPESKLSLAQVQILDAVNAVYLEQGSKVDVRQCLFRNNLYGIRFNPEDDHSSTLLTCRNNTFEGGGQGLKSDFSTFYNWPFTGLEINNKPNVWDVGNNVFRHIQNGIIANNSRLFPSLQPYFWSTNVFHDIYPKQSTTNRNFGNGIYINGSPGILSSNLYGASSYQSFGFESLNYNENFKDCLRGIQIKGARVFVIDNDLVECDTAILVRDCNYPSPVHKSLFDGNWIENSVHLGIGFFGNGMQYQAEVIDNDIIVESIIPSTGIRVFGNLLDQNIRIGSNVIDINSEGFGIEIESALGVRIYGQNEFNVSSTGYNYKCVYALGGSTATQVIDNYFNGFDQGYYNNTTTPYRVGVEIDDLDFTFVDCNVFDNVATSLMHKGYALNSFIRSNLFKSGIDGYSLGNEDTGGAFIGEQSFGKGANQNAWPTTTTGKYYPSYDARSFHDNPLEEIDNRFWVDYEDVPLDNNPFWPDKIQSASGQWFLADQDWSAAGVNCVTHVLPDPSEELTRIEQALINDTLNLGFDYYNYRAVWSFLGNLDRYPELLEITDVSQWQSDMNLTATGQLYKFKQSVRDVVVMDEASEEMLDSLGGLQWALMTDLYELDSTLIEDGTLDSLQWVNYLELAGELSDLTETISDIYLDYYGSLQDTLTALGDVLSNIEVSDLYDSNLKSVMQIWLYSTLMQDSVLSEDQIGWLDTLGQTCRFVNGPAVLIARGLLRNIGISQPYDDSPDCLGDPINKEAQTRIGNAFDSNWKVMPNLTSGEFVLITPELKSHNSYLLEILDLNGITHYMGRHASSRQLLDISGFSAGMYWVRIIPEEGQPAIVRVVKN